MRAVLLSSADGRGGGAFTAVYRLHRGLRAVGVDSVMLVGNKTRDDHSVIGSANRLTQVWSKAAPVLDLVPLRLYRQREQVPFSLQWLPDRIAPRVKQVQPDLVHLHWVCGGYLQIGTLAQLGQPLVWTMHDMWPFTGGCHYADQCERYRNACGGCPQLRSANEWDLSRLIWQAKLHAWKSVDITLVAISRWIAECARASSLFGERRIEVIPNGLDTRRYRPLGQQTAREVLGLPPDRCLVLFGAVGGTRDRRKGFHLLQLALQSLRQSVGDRSVELMVFGASQAVPGMDVDFPVHYLGYLHDDVTLALAYSAADVMVVPSLQESFGQTASEALACGVPVVAFATGGLKDIVDHCENGYLALPFDPDDLAHGIAWVIEDPERWRKLSAAARCKAETTFEVTHVAAQHAALYAELLEARQI